MTRERCPKDQGTHSEVRETQSSRPLTHGEFYLAMTERPDSQGLGLRPELRSLFVGQERAYKELYEGITQSPSGTVVAITAPFGAGKDALMDVVTTDLVASGMIQQDEIKRIHVDIDLEEGITFEEVVSERRRWAYAGKPSDENIHDHTRVKTLVVNEVAYGWIDNSKESLQKQLAIAGKFLGKEVPIMVLLGDYALEDPEIVGAVGSPHEPVIIKLDPLTPDMLKETLRRRVAYALERLPEEIDVDAILDPEFLTALIPNTEYPIATMRTSLVVLESIGRRLKPTEEQLRISKELARKVYLGNELYEDFWREPDRKQQFILWLIQRINDHGNSRDEMKAMTVEEMMQACPLDIAPDVYKKRIIDEMSRTYTGIQRVSTSPDLYLPRQELFLRTALRAMPLDPYSKEGQVEVKRIEELVDRGTYKQEDVNINAWNPVWDPLVEKMRLIYGWNSNFSRYIVVGALSSLEERRKAKKESEERRMRGG